MTTDAINFLRAAITVLLFMLFVVLIAWAWSPRRRKDFEAASRIPFEQ
jgi:cbb3-type cytochrome oxidase subunit 3